MSDNIQMIRTVCFAFEVVRKGLGGARHLEELTEGRRIGRGRKPNIALIGFIGPTEVVPCYKAFKILGEVELRLTPSLFSERCFPAAVLRGSAVRY
jgi:hypothetical protein